MTQPKHLFISYILREPPIPNVHLLAQPKIILKATGQVPKTAYTVIIKSYLPRFTLTLLDTRHAITLCRAFS
jgi:hypothetical protein